MPLTKSMVKETIIEVIRNLNEEEKELAERLFAVFSQKLEEKSFRKKKLSIPNLDDPRNKTGLELARYMYRKIIDELKLTRFKNNPPNLTNWMREMRRLVYNDGLDVEEIKRVIDWVVHDEFWSMNVLSPSALRRHWEKLVVRMRRDEKNKAL